MLRSEKTFRINKALLARTGKVVKMYRVCRMGKIVVLCVCMKDKQFRK